MTSKLALHTKTLDYTMQPSKLQWGQSVEGKTEYIIPNIIITF